MSSIKINSAINIGIEEVLNGVSNLETAELENFLKEVGHLLVQKKVKTLSKLETKLLLIINSRLLSGKGQKQYDTLYDKLRQEKITSAEHIKLLSLIKKKRKKGWGKISSFD